MTCRKVRVTLPLHIPASAQLQVQSAISQLQSGNRFKQRSCASVVRGFYILSGAYSVVCRLLCSGNSYGALAYCARIIKAN
ncbi:hypothetical protein J6590_002055 [Homalodisca vitripennis]|nr:hypothetical protein J6590_002055 [Homalodisca vitripennis]